MKATQLYKDLSQKLKQAKVAESELEARWFLSWLLQIPEISLWTNSGLTVSPENLERAADFLRRRLEGEPFAYIVGQREFFGREFAVNRHTLIPRPESEMMVTEALKFVTSRHQSIAVCDFGAGTGCLGISIVCELPEAYLTTVEVSSEALKVVQQNIKRHGLSARSRLIEGDVANAALGESFDIVVANPPYIDVNDSDIETAVKKYEPHLALFSGDGGLAHVKAWSLKAAESLKPGGLYLCEIGAKQADSVIELIKDLDDFTSIEVLKDLAQKPRVLRAIRKRV